jgi:hypothetical protein
MCDIITFYSESHRVFFDRHFAPSIRLSPGHRLIAYETPQQGSGEFRTSGWVESMTFKLDIILEACKANKPFIYADCDLRWYAPTAEAAAYMQGCDMAIQDDGIAGYCAGLIMVNRPQRVRGIFGAARELLRDGKFPGDQPALNHLLALPDWRQRIHLRPLPPRFWSYGQGSSFEWYGQEELCPPRDIITHHANWTRGSALKLKMLEQVASIVEEKRRG